MATQRKNKTSYAENGRSSAPEGRFAEIISSTSFWQKEPCKDDAEIEQRLAEFKNLAAERDKLPTVENMCLYLGATLDEFKAWQKGVDCSERRKRAIGQAVTWLAAVEANAVYSNLVRDVPYIWRSKQYYDMKEPNSDVNINIGRSPLKMLPTIDAIVAQGYLTDADDTEGGK